MKIGIYVPAYQVEAHLKKTIERIDFKNLKEITEVLIFDDGSSDNTFKSANELSLANPLIKVLQNQTNQGYGAVVKKCWEYFKTRDVDAIVCLHGDGQYDPLLLKNFITVLKTGVDLVQGSRHANKGALKGGMPLYKYLAGKALVLLENFTFRHHFSDYHSGYIAFSKNYINQVDLSKMSNSFVFDLESIACAKANKFSLKEIAIPTHYGDEESHLNVFKYGLSILMVLKKFISRKYHFDKK